MSGKKLRPSLAHPRIPNLSDRWVCHTVAILRDPEVSLVPTPVLVLAVDEGRALVVPTTVDSPSLEWVALDSLEVSK